MAVAGIDAPAPVRAYVGEVLRVHRKRVAMTQQELDDKLYEFSLPVSEVEAGRAVVTPRFLGRAEAVLDAGGLLDGAAALLEHERHRSSVTHYWDPELINRAHVVSWWSPHAVPDLLQVPEYTLALLRGRLPQPRTAAIERSLHLLAQRQMLLARESRPALWFLLDEAVLRRNVGGVETMRRQLDLLVECATLPRVVIQLVPLGGRGRYPELMSPSVLFEFEEGAPFAAVEDYDGARIVHEGEGEVTSHFNRLRGYGLSPERSLELIEETAKHLASYPAYGLPPE